MPVSERTRIEMERGRTIAGRKQRESDMSRLRAGKKVRVTVAMPGHAHYEPVGQVNLFYVDGVEVAHQNIRDDDYPSETVMAFVQLAVSCTTGYDGVPSEETIDPRERAARDAYRMQMHNNAVKEGALDE